MSILSRLRFLFTAGRGVLVGVSDATLDRDPIELFGEWFGAARRCGIRLPEVMTVATCTRDGRPSARMALLKAHDSRGFVFYTNYASRKARELEENPRATLLFYWAVLERQVCVEGSVSRITPEESAAYFRTRPRGSRIAAWASRQSEALVERAELEERFQETRRRFRGGEVPLPRFWGGYRVVAEKIEFWQGRANRLHDRLVFVRNRDGWDARRLYP